MFLVKLFLHMHQVSINIYNRSPSLTSWEKYHVKMRGVISNLSFIFGKNIQSSFKIVACGWKGILIQLKPIDEIWRMILLFLLGASRNMALLCHLWRKSCTFRKKVMSFCLLASVFLLSRTHFPIQQWLDNVPLCIIHQW